VPIEEEEHPVLSQFYELNFLDYFPNEGRYSLLQLPPSLYWLNVTLKQTHRTVYLAKSISFIPSIFLQSTLALNKIKFVTIIKTATCFDTEVPFSGDYKTKDYKPIT
jgi:hypothetical protein